MSYDNELYQQVILDHNRKPRNFREIENPSYSCHGINPLCGDDIMVFLDVDDQEVIQDVSFTGSGCAISKASSSLMTTNLKGKKVDEARVIFDEFHKMQINVSQNMGNFYSNQKTAREMDSKTLRDKIKSLKEGGVSTRSLKVEYHMKKSIPVACFVFGLLGICDCLIFISSGKDWWGVIISICLAVLSVGFYFFIMSFFRALGKDGSLSPHMAAWVPNMIYGSICLITLAYQGRYK